MILNVIRNKNSILGRLIQFISALISLIIIFISIIYTMREYYYLNQSINNEVDITGKIIGFNYDSNNTVIQKILDSLKTQQAINSAVVTDNKNNIRASYSKHNIKINIENPETYTKKLSILNHGTEVGQFYIHANYSELNAFLIKAMYISSWILLISILISSVFAYLYSKSLCNPLLKLNNNMKKVIDESDYDIKSEIKKGPDEILNLNKIFNLMIDKINKRDKEIKQYNNLLKQDIEKKDIALQESYEQLQFAAYHDELTHLPNIKLFRTVLSHCLDNAKANNTKFAVLFIDIDNFKQVNDTFGHDVGDELLKEVSSVISNIIRRSDFLLNNEIYNDVLPVSRLGGDEFTIILNNVVDEDDTNLIVNRLRTNIYNIKKIKDYNIHISVSIGIAMYPIHGEDPSTLLKNADAAMYYAKTHGKNKFQHYNNSIGNNIKHRLKIESYLADAIINNEFIIDYQPKIDINNNQLIGVEALIRWDHPKHGIIGPDKFIDISEDSELICAISDIVIEKICEDIKIWQKNNIDYKSVAINISIRQFKKENFVENICSIIGKHGINFNNIELELTEGMLINNFDEAIAKLKLLKNIGFCTTIDDFGTGYSSFKYLSRLPLDTIKIDKSFVHDLDSNSNNHMIVKSIINLAHSLSMSVVAEGVETKEIVDILAELNCDFAQGYYYSRPVKSEDLIKCISSISKLNQNIA